MNAKYYGAMMLIMVGCGFTATSEASGQGAVGAKSKPTKQIVVPGRSRPERDSRGVIVISDPAEAPAGSNQPLIISPGDRVVINPNQRAIFQPRPATESYPACSKTVTDNCVQFWEGPRGIPNCPGDPECPEAG